MKISKKAKGFMIATALVAGSGFLTQTAGASTSKPDSHTSWIDQKNESEERVHAKTVWKGVDHYSRARYENRSGTIKGDSGRKYNPEGSSTSQAVSGYVSTELTTYVAHTYWGKK